MTREEIEKDRQYQLTGAAIDYCRKEHPHYDGEALGEITDAFEAGAEWADKTMIDKACKWLDDNFMNLIWGKTRSVYAGGNFATVDEMIADFRKAMEGKL